MKAKMVMATMAALATGGVGTGAFLLLQSKPAPAASVPAPATSNRVAAIQLANDGFVGVGGYMESVAAMGQQLGPKLLSFGANFRQDDRFLNDVAPEVRRTTNSPPAGHIKCLVEATPADYLVSVSNRPLQACRFIYHVVTSNSPLLGQRIRASGWLKTSNVAVMAGATLVVMGPTGRVFANDPMTDRPLLGTADWKEVELVADVPSEPCTIYLGPALYGTGELWADDFKIAVVSRDKPITDDRKWHVWSPNPGDYSVTTDFENQRNGHPSLCITYIPGGPAPAGSWMWWGQCIRETDQYKGHIVRMTVWMKSEKTSHPVYPNLRPKGPFFNLVAKYRRETGKITQGTTPWTKQTFICNIPEETQCLDTGFAFRGSGKVWIDMDSLKYEFADGPAR